jgi:hypothetical protein
MRLQLSGIAIEITNAALRHVLKTRGFAVKRAQIETIGAFGGRRSAAQHPAAKLSPCRRAP